MNNNLICVTCLIINWNGASDTLELVSSLCCQITDNLNIDVVIIDNASESENLNILQNGLEELKSKIQITLICNKNNVGIPAAYNQAILASKDKDAYFLRLDNDVIMLNGSIMKLCNVLKENTNRGVRLVGGNIKYFDAPEEDNGGAVYFDLLRGKTTSTYPSSDTLCDGILGCVMLIDPEVINKLYPDVFLSWLFLTTDESELSMRCQQLGWSTYYIAEAIALHKGGKSTNKVPYLSTWYSRRNWSYLAIKYVKPRVLISVVLVRLLVTIAYKFIKGDFSAVSPMLKGIFAALFGKKKHTPNSVQC